MLEMDWQASVQDAEKPQVVLSLFLEVLPPLLVMVVLLTMTLLYLTSSFYYLHCYLLQQELACCRHDRCRVIVLQKCVAPEQMK